ncbi:brain acid soluble protein 1-like [Felis catus]|uniref:brain acid soluble protein 1-like n=1 Tax=Felis catus TaxID=9685 RepID=UPI001D19E075|nr:brain acid soluble protein 1-like [Felis catus]
MMCGAPPPRGAPATQSLPACVRGSCGGVTGVKVTWRHLCAERRRCCAPGSLGRGRRRQPARREAALSSPARSLGGRWREQKGKRKRPWFRSPAPRSSSPHSAPPSPVRHRESPQTCPTRAGIGVQPTANGERPSLVQAGAAPVEAVRCVLRPAPSAGPQVRAELPAPSSGPDFGVYPSPTRLPGFRCPASEFKDTAPEEGRTQNALICHPVRAPQSCPKRPVPRGDRPLRDPTPRSFQSGETKIWCWACSPRQVCLAARPCRQTELGDFRLYISHFSMWSPSLPFRGGLAGSPEVAGLGVERAGSSRARRP